jgi:hypothetical protein
MQLAAKLSYISGVSIVCERRSSAARKNFEAIH